MGYLLLGIGLQCAFGDAIGTGAYYKILNCGFPISTIESPVGLYNNLPVIPLTILGVEIGVLVEPLILNSVFWAMLFVAWSFMYSFLKKTNYV